MRYDLPALDGYSGKDVITVFDGSTAFANAVNALPAGRHDNGGSWEGGKHIKETARLCIDGDLSRVPPSDAFLSKMENLVRYAAPMFKNIDAMTGGVPNVPAFLAGQPMNMRRRQRVASEQAPLNIFVDIVSSGGIDTPHLEKRGAAILALVRLLSAQRPVNLYLVAAGSPGANGVQSSACAFRIDTAPLDLARAAHCLVHAGVARQGAYGVIAHQVNKSAGFLGWAYSNVDFYRANGARYWQRVLPVDDALFVPPPFLSDACIDNPEQWLRDMLARYGNMPTE